MDGRADAWSIAPPMRAPLLAFALLAATACTQSNVQLPPLYDGGPNVGDASLGSDGAADGSSSGEDGAVESGGDTGAIVDAASEAKADSAPESDGGAEASPGDSGSAD